MSHSSQQNSGADRPLRQLFLLLFTAAVSFALGVVIGRSSALVQPIIKVTMPATKNQPAESQNFNFYKALPKGETTALGSGINRRDSLPATLPPPSAPKSQGETTAPSAPIEISGDPSASAPPSIKDKRHESWILQASSSPHEEDAQRLGERLRRKGYKAEIKPTLIKGKTWFRVYVGPYSTAATAKKAAATLSRQEGLSPITRKI